MTYVAWYLYTGFVLAATLAIRSWLSSRGPADWTPLRKTPWYAAVLGYALIVSLWPLGVVVFVNAVRMAFRCGGLR